MSATKKQIDYIKIIFNEVNYNDEVVKYKTHKTKRDMCLSDYYDIFFKLEENKLTRKEAGYFITRWFHFARDIKLKRNKINENTKLITL